MYIIVLKIPTAFNKYYRNAKITRDYYVKLCAKKLDLKNIDKFLEIYNLPTLNQKEIENISRSLPVTTLNQESKTPNQQKSRIRQVNYIKHLKT